MEETASVIKLLNEHLAIAPQYQLIPEDTVSSLEKLKAILVQEIHLLLEKDFEGLLQAMYRIDIQESAFQACLAQGDIERLADLIIQRELQKVIMREKYKNF